MLCHLFVSEAVTKRRRGLPVIDAVFNTDTTLTNAKGILGRDTGGTLDSRVTT